MVLSDELHANLKSTYKDKDVIVTGGASFIGSSLVADLLEYGAKVTVIDNFSSGKLDNIDFAKQFIKILNIDLSDRNLANKEVNSADFVFHLAAVHGGRGFIEKYKQEMLVNLSIDNNVFSAASMNGVGLVVHASSACAYPIGLQDSEFNLNFLEESQASMEKIETSFPDGVYGWTKLLGEYQLENFSSYTLSGGGMKGRSARIFTAYGEKENESHAAIALIAKALLKADPYPIWGSGQQTRNFTYVKDTVTGLLILGSDIRPIPFDVFNIGTSSHTKVIDFVSEIFNKVGWEPSALDLQLEKPVGVASRASNNSKIKNVFGWEPSTPVSVGVARTVSWYESSGLLPTSLKALEEKLLNR